MGLVRDLLPQSFWTTGGDGDEYDPAGGCRDSGRGINDNEGSSKLAGQGGNNYSDRDKAQKECEPFHLHTVVWVGWFSCRRHEENLLWDTSTHHLDFSWLSQARIPK